MFIASLSENKEIEKTLAVTPEITKKYIDLGLDLLLPKNYVSNLGFDDSDYKSLVANFFDSDDYAHDNHCKLALEIAKKKKCPPWIITSNEIQDSYLSKIKKCEIPTNPILKNLENGNTLSINFLILG